LPEKKIQGGQRVNIFWLGARYKREGIEISQVL